MDHLKVNNIIYNEHEASRWIWSNLWTRDVETKASFRILDAIVWHKKRIQSWIFTATTDGLIKSKSRPRWNLQAIQERCQSTDISNTGSGSGLNVNACISGTWFGVSDPEELSKICDSESLSFLVPYGQVSNKGFYIEHEYEVNLLYVCVCVYL